MKKKKIYLLCAFLCLVLGACFFVYKFKISQENRTIVSSISLKDQSSKVSVIIPAYNVEQYIDECLNSVLNQTYKNLEIIIVDDYSTDNTYNILKNYAKKDNRIKLYRMKKNGGVSRARNEGLKHITGNYLYWIDSDDWIDLNYIETMVGIAEKTGVDIVVNKNTFICYTNKNNKLKCKKYNLINKNNINGYDSLNGKNSFVIFPFLWNNLIRVSFLKQVKPYFPEDTWGEDAFFMMQLLSNTENTYILYGDRYYYRRRPNSLATSREWHIEITQPKMYKLFYEWVKKNNLIDKRKLFCMNDIMFNMDRHEKKEEFYKQLRELFIEIKPDVEKNKDIYLNEELGFFNKVIKHNTYEDYYKDYKNFIIITIFYCIIIFLIIIFCLIVFFKCIYLFILDFIKFIKNKK